MKSVNMHEAKTHLSRLVEAASKGEAFIIARAGKPLVKVVPIEEPAPRSRFGFLKGVTVPDDFDTFMQDEIIAMFEESEIFPPGLRDPDSDPERGPESGPEADRGTGAKPTDGNTPSDGSK